MEKELSKSQIDRLGDRLRKGSREESDLRVLDEYRRSFGEAYASVVFEIRVHLKLEPTGRPAKSTTSVIEKLQRESIRLSQVQDIAGCRIVVEDITDQNMVVTTLKKAFPDSLIVDRRTNPSHGYRAVHVIVRILGKPIEIQIRSNLQHLWAEFSEKLSDIKDTSIKYGGGPEDVRSGLLEMSKIVADFEKSEATFEKFKKSGDSPQQQKLKYEIKELRDKITTLIRDSIIDVDKRTGDKNHDISN